MRYTAEQVVEKLRAAGGNVTEAARALGCDRRTVYRYRDRFASVREALESERETVIDEAEGALRNMILDPSHRSHAAAVIFALKTIGKDRGYVERQQIEQIGAEITDAILDALEHFMSPEGFREATDALAKAEQLDRLER